MVIPAVDDDVDVTFFINALDYKQSCWTLLILLPPVLLSTEVEAVAVKLAVIVAMFKGVHIRSTSAFRAVRNFRRRLKAANAAVTFNVNEAND